MATTTVQEKVNEINGKLQYGLNLEALIVRDPNPVAVELNKAMVERMAGKVIKDFGEKMYDESGKKLEILASSLGHNTNVPVGGAAVVYSNGLLSFSKTVKRPTKSVDTKKMHQFLLTAGVPSELLDRATEYATVERKAPTYLTVTQVSN